MKKIFFAIPCGDFYTIQNKIIDDICKNHNVCKIVIEEKSKTDYLWKDITNEINSSDIFVCDISSMSSNIVIELGYALSDKAIDMIGIFVSENIDVFSDIKGIKYQKYRSYSEFAELLEKWISEKLHKSNYKRTTLNIPKFHEEFKDLSKFIRLWDTPPSCQYSLKCDGLHFSYSHLPIMSNHLGLLQNYSFEFKAKILSKAVGWIIKGTKEPNDIILQFCLMFNVGVDGELMPHIFNRNNIHKKDLYHRLTSLSENIGKIDKNTFYDIKTTVNGDLVEIYFERSKVFSHTFGTHSQEKDLYNIDKSKDGQVGFRCHQYEEAVIKDVNIEIIK